MASDKDILSKADALLRRHSPPGTDTAGVPLLTDLIHDPGESVSNEELAREISAEVMAEVESRVGSAIADLRLELAGMIEEAVAAAIERRNVK